MNVIKSDGSTELLDMSKIRKSLTYAMRNVNNVSLEEIDKAAKLHLYDNITTAYILDVFIKTTYDMSSLKHIGYDEVSKNLKLQRLYKQVHGSVTTIPTIVDFVIANNHLYSNRVIDTVLHASFVPQLEAAIDHSRDRNYTASGIDKEIDSYMIKVNTKPVETPQFMYMLIAIDIFADYHQTPVQYILDTYEALSTFKVTLPTPEKKALRTTSTDYASCVTIRIGDNINSWIEASKAIVSHTVASAGIGIDISDIASIGDLVKSGTIKHGGKIPIIKSADTDVNKSVQNGRRGSGTIYVNFFDPEIEEILSLKSPRTAIDKRINDLSYGIKLNQLAYDYAKADKQLGLFSVRDVPDLYEAFYKRDQTEFNTLYAKYMDDKLYKSTIPATQLHIAQATEESETSSYYTLNIDEVNDHTNYKQPIVQSNICIEFCTPTLPVSSLTPDEPAIGICSLSNINQGLVPHEQLAHYTDLLVRAQTHIGKRQVHPTPQANAFVAYYADIGIGFSNHAYWLAANNYRYGQQQALDAHNLWMEYFSHGLISASVAIARETSPAPGYWTDTRKLFPIDTYKRTVDKLVSPSTLDWIALKHQALEHGMANCGLAMVPPSESSSIPSNQTSSIEPIRDLLTIKDQAGINFKQFAPNAYSLADKYDLAYDRDINVDYIKHVAVTQKWIDKSISMNYFYNPTLYKDNKVPISKIIGDKYLAKYYGIKSKYYHNTYVEDMDIEQASCTDGGCSV